MSLSLLHFQHIAVKCPAKIHVVDQKSQKSPKALILAHQLSSLKNENDGLKADLQFAEKMASLYKRLYRYNNYYTALVLLSLSDLHVTFFFPLQCYQLISHLENCIHIFFL